MARKLRIAASVFFGLAAVALCLLWARSYRASDDVRIPLPGTNTLRLDSMRGRLILHMFHGYPHLHHWDWIIGYPVDVPGMWDNYDQQVRAWHWIPMGTATAEAFVLPHWFPALLMGLLAAGVWVRYSFSLRTLLITTTLLALLLGLGVWLTR